jgi:hypothetical protein
MHGKSLPLICCTALYITGRSIFFCHWIFVPAEGYLGHELVKHSQPAREFRLYPVMPLPWFIVVLLNAHPFSPSPSLELVERLDGLAGAGQDTEDVEADL